MKLIDKADVVAEIKRRMNEEVNYDEDSKDFASYADFTHYSTLNTLLDFLDTLEVKEVDLEKEIKRFTMSKELYETDSVIRTVAKHFFELGIKTKGE